MRERYARGELARQILMLFLVGGVVVACATFPGIAYLLEAFGAKNAKQRARVRQSVRGMEKNRLLMHRVRRGKEEIIVTDKGKRQIMSYLLSDLRIERPKKWNKKWHVLMYDIPETKKLIRDEVNIIVRDMGMKTIQNSVFVSPFPCKKEIDLITAYYDVKRYFIYFEATDIESQEDLLRTFNLK